MSRTIHDMAVAKLRIPIIRSPMLRWKNIYIERVLLANLTEANLLRELLRLEYGYDQPHRTPRQGRNGTRRLI